MLNTATKLSAVYTIFDICTFVFVLFGKIVWSDVICYALKAVLTIKHKLSRYCFKKCV